MLVKMNKNLRVITKPKYSQQQNSRNDSCYDCLREQRRNNNENACFV